MTGGAEGGLAVGGVQQLDSFLAAGVIHDNSMAANNSFLFFLHERDRFDIDALRRLLDSIDVLEVGTKEVLMELNDIEFEILKHIIYHFDPMDLSHIENLPEDYWEYIVALQQAVRRFLGRCI